MDLLLHILEWPFMFVEQTKLYVSFLLYLTTTTKNNYTSPTQLLPISRQNLNTEKSVFSSANTCC